MHDLADGVRHLRAHALGAQRCRLGQPVQVLPLGPVEPQGAGHRVKDLHAGVDLAALLEPGVPGNAHSGQQRDLLAAKPGRAPPRAPRHTEITRAEPGPACLQELTKLGPPLLPGPLLSGPLLSGPLLSGAPRRFVRSSFRRFVCDQGFSHHPIVPVTTYRYRLTLRRFRPGSGVRDTNVTGSAHLGWLRWEPDGSGAAGRQAAGAVTGEGLLRPSFCPPVSGADPITVPLVRRTPADRPGHGVRSSFSAEVWTCPPEASPGQPATGPPDQLPGRNN